jgi:hypothetical protein
MGDLNEDYPCGDQTPSHDGNIALRTEVGARYGVGLGLGVGVGLGVGAGARVGVGVGVGVIPSVGPEARTSISQYLSLEFPHAF